MRKIDYSDNPRIAIMQELVASLSRAETPAEVLHAYSTGLIRLNGPSGFLSLSCRGLKPGEYRITRLLNQDNVADIHKTDPWRTIDRYQVHSGGLLGEIIQEGKPIVITDLDLRDDPVLGDVIADYRSLLAIPLYDHGEPLNWGIQLRHDSDIWDAEQLEDSLLRSNLVGGTVRHVQMAAQLREAHEQIRREVERIADIQRALLPQRIPEISGVSVATSYQTFDQAGGDMYFLHPLGTDPTDPDKQHDGRWGLFIGDVSGHGPAAAVVMSMVETLLGAYPSSVGSAGDVLEYLNRHVYAKRIEQTFVTAWAAAYDPATRELKYARAGHPPPLWRKPSGNGQIAIEPLDAVGGLPLGILDDQTYEQTSIMLEPGQTLVLYSDGISETRNPGGEFFGTAGIEQAVHICSGEAACAVDSITRSVKEYEAGGRPQDDQTLVVMHVRE